MTDRPDRSDADSTDASLEDFFAAGRRARAEPDEMLLGRILADAAEIGSPSMAAPSPRPGTGPLTRLAAWVGGASVAVPVLGCLTLGLAIGLSGTGDYLVLAGLDVALGTADILNLGYDAEGMSLIVAEAGL